MSGWPAPKKWDTAYGGKITIFRRNLTWLEVAAGKAPPPVPPPSPDDHDFAEGGGTAKGFALVPRSGDANIVHSLFDQLRRVIEQHPAAPVRFLEKAATHNCAFSFSYRKPIYDYTPVENMMKDLSTIAAIIGPCGCYLMGMLHILDEGTGQYGQLYINDQRVAYYALSHNPLSEYPWEAGLREGASQPLAHLVDWNGTLPLDA